MIIDNEGIFAKKYIARLKRRLSHLNSNFLIIVTGKPGSGKSYFCLALAKQVYPDFKIYENMFYNSTEMLRALAHDKIKKKEVYILEESGVDLNSRRAMSKKNTTLSAVFQTIRFKNFGLILNLPNISMIDSSLRKLVHFHCRMQKIDRKKKLGIALVSGYEFDDVSGLLMTPFPQFTVENVLYKLKFIGLPKPDTLTIKAYEDMKQAFSKDFYNKALKDLEDNKPTEKSIKRALDKARQEISSNPERFLTTSGKVFDKNYIQHHFGIPHKEAILLKRELDFKISKKNKDSTNNNNSVKDTLNNEGISEKVV